MEEVKCDFCGSEKYKKLAHQTDIYHNVTSDYFDIVECENCKLVYTNPRPNEEDIGKYYSTEYDFHSSKSKLKLTLLYIMEAIANSPFIKLFKYVPFFNKQLVTYIKPKIKDPVFKYINSSKSLLDIGCGSGVSAHFWGKNGALLNYQNYLEVHGVEISDDARVNLKEKGINNYKNIDDVPEDMKFDIIRMNWSLEHVHSPSKFFEFIKKHLTKDGVAIIMVPNMDGLLYKIAVDSVELPIHLYHFKKVDMENYGEKFNLEVVNFESFSYPQMYRFLSAQNGKLKNIFEDIKVEEAYNFQKVLNRFDKLDMGNDMILEFKHKNLS